MVDTVECMTAYMPWQVFKNMKYFVKGKKYNNMHSFFFSPFSQSWEYSLLNLLPLTHWLSIFFLPLEYTWLNYASWILNLSSVVTEQWSLRKVQLIGPKSSNVARKLVRNLLNINEENVQNLWWVNVIKTKLLEGYLE